LSAADHAAAPEYATSHHLSPRAKLEILFAVLLALFMFALDQAIVSVALPTIVGELGAGGQELYAWSITIYLLTSTISGPIYGKLSDLFGRRPIFIWAVGLFLVASVGAGLSQNAPMFILFRGLQGLGGGAVFPLAFAVLADLYTPAERGKYSGYFGAVFGLSSIIGPALGGLITDNFGWHWIFFINVPIALVSLYVIFRLLPAIKRPEAARNIDYVGAALFTAAIGPFLVGLSNKANSVWTDLWVGGLIALGVVFGLVFLWWERRAAEPIVVLPLFRIRTFTISVLAMFLMSFGFFAAIVYLPLWFQVVSGSSATESGYQLLPLLGALIVSATVSGQIVARTHRYKLLILGSMVTLTVGLLLLTNLHANTDHVTLWIWMAIAGAGIGPAFAVFTLIVSAAVPMRQIGVASSSLTFFQQIGGTIGLTIASTLFASRLMEEVPRQLVTAGVPQEFVSQFAGNAGAFNLTAPGDLGARILANVPEQFRPLIEPIIQNIVYGIHEAISVALANAIWVGVGAAIIAVIAVLFLKEVPLRSTWDEMPPEAAAAMGGTDAVEYTEEWQKNLPRKS
jgi:EmrB/QacA subfamily drug resistance transporter